MAEAARNAVKSGMKPIFVTILTGFLGSGKTTLINYLLKNNDSEKIAIIENEFGEINIDKVIIGANDTQIIELSGGCVCCSIRGELSKELSNLALKIKNNELATDRFILETTGLADPAPIIQAFFTDEFIRENFILDAVITLADAKHIQKQLDEHRVAATQIGFADRIILTKTDLIDKKMRNDTLARLNAINQKAVILEAIEGKIEKKLWIGINAFEFNDALKFEDGFYQSVKNKKSLKFTKFSTAKIRSFSDDIVSFALRAGELDFDKLDAFLEKLVNEFGNDMLRYKGVLAIKNESDKLILQGVHKVAGVDYGSVWKEDEKRISLMIIIGRALPSDEITKQFLACESL